jgi:RNA polymerase sigma-70 factor, ECF subfamily
MSSPIHAYPQDAVRAEPRVANETQLVPKSTRTDAKDFEVLALRYRRLILGIVCRITGSVVDAEDVTQQALTKTFINHPRFERRSSFSTWLMRLTRNEL